MTDTTTTTAGAGRSWGLRLLLGVLTALVGIVLLVWPTRSLLLVAVLFGLELIFLGAIRIGTALSEATGNRRTLGIVLGVLTILAGAFCFARPGASLLVVAVLLAVGFLLDGIAGIARAGRDSTGRARTAVIVTAVLSIVAGIVVVAFPVGSLSLLAQVGGIVLIVLGVVQVIGAVGSRTGRG